MMLFALPLAGPDDTAGFWRQARAALAAGCAPGDISFVLPSDTADMFAPMSLPVSPPEPREPSDPVTIPSAMEALVDSILLHADPERFALGYRLLWRVQRETRLAAIASDPDVARAADFAKSVRRDMHKMTAFVRFREREEAPGLARYVAWFEPQHHIVRAVAPFFVGRFTGMHWSILTPTCCAHWDGESLSFSAGARKADAPEGDPLEDVWRTYYGSTFNPARLKVKAMTAHMPKKYWHNLPEAELIAPLVRSALTRSADMVEAPPTLPRRVRLSVPAGGAPAPPACGTLSNCTRCSLYKCATQVVPGEGPSDARMMFVGEQPGDAEDLAGRPFVGPAGKLLSTALERVAIDRRGCYLTNAVKHFKFEPRGKRRIHKSPNRQEIDHCRWWLDQERDLIKPEVIVALGVSAVRGLTGEQVTLSSVRSRALALDARTQMVATVHPAYLLRLTDEGQKRDEWKRFLADLQLARDLLQPA